MVAIKKGILQSFWISRIMAYIELGALPTNPIYASIVKRRDNSYSILRGTVYIKGLSTPSGEMPWGRRSHIYARRRTWGYLWTKPQGYSHSQEISYTGVLLIIYGQRCQSMRKKVWVMLEGWRCLCHPSIWA